MDRAGLLCGRYLFGGCLTMFMYTDYNQHLLDNVKKIHFIGCGGSGMYPLLLECHSPFDWNHDFKDVHDASFEDRKSTRLNSSHS